jgi:hypothetical protein
VAAGMVGVVAAVPVGYVRAARGVDLVGGGGNGAAGRCWCRRQRLVHGRRLAGKLVADREGQKGGSGAGRGLPASPRVCPSVRRRRVAAI